MFSPSDSPLYPGGVQQKLEYGGSILRSSRPPTLHSVPALAPIEVPLVETTPVLMVSDHCTLPLFKNTLVSPPSYKVPLPHLLA